MEIILDFLKFKTGKFFVQLYIFGIGLNEHLVGFLCEFLEVIPVLLHVQSLIVWYLVFPIHKLMLLSIGFVLHPEF